MCLICTYVEEHFLSHVEEDLHAPGKYYALLWEIIEGKFEEKATGWRCCAGWKRLQGIGALSARTLRLLPITPTHEAGLSTFISKPNLLWATPLFRPACNWCTGKAHLQMFNWFLFSMLPCSNDEEGELEVSFFVVFLLYMEESFYIVYIVYQQAIALISFYQEIRKTEQC